MDNLGLLHIPDFCMGVALGEGDAQRFADLEHAAVAHDVSLSVLRHAEAAFEHGLRIEVLQMVGQALQCAVPFRQVAVGGQVQPDAEFIESGLQPGNVRLNPLQAVAELF